MNLKFALAAALFISSGTFVAQAQQASTTKNKVTLSAAKAFEKKVTAYKNAPDATSSATNFESLKTDMINGIGASKSAMAAATNDAERKNMTDQMNARIGASNTAIQLFNTNPGNKAAIIEALNQYAKTL